MLTFDPIFFNISRTRTFCWMYMSSGDFPGASSRFIPASPVALERQMRNAHRHKHSIASGHEKLFSWLTSTAIDKDAYILAK